MITDKKLQLELLKLEDPTLEEVRTCIRNYERAILNQKDTSNRGLQVKQGSQKPASQPSTSKAEEKKKPCYRCDSDKHDHTACPHKENVCPHCNKVGHTKKACRALKKEQKEKPKEQARTVSQEQQQPAQSADAQQPNSVNQVTRLAGSDYWGAVRQTPRCQIF